MNVHVVLLFLQKGDSMNNRKTEEKASNIQLMEEMESNLSDFALFLTVMKRRKVYLYGAV